MPSPYIKPFLPVEKQIKLLRSRGMLINNEAMAEKYLAKVGYYRLSGYWFPFRNKDSVTLKKLDTFHTGTTFEQAFALYIFDRKLRLLFLDALERIEIALRTDIALMLGKINPLVHRNPMYFDGRFTKRSGRKNMSQHDYWLEKQDRLSKRSKQDFTKQYKQKYTTPLPIWMAIEVWDFGMMSTLLTGMKNNHKIKIADKYHISRPDIMISWIRSLNFIRNVCAHHSRLWNISPVDQPKLHQNGQITQLDHIINDLSAHTKIYAQAAIMQFFLKEISPESHWSDRLKKIIDELPQITSISERIMGFPQDWQKLDLWN